MENARRTIDISGYLKRLKNNFKIIVIIILAGVVVGSVFSVVSGNAITSEEKTYQKNQEKLKNAEAALTNNDIKDVNASFQSYQSLDKQKKTLQKFVKNSIYLNLDDSTAKAEKIVYTITNNNKSNSILNSYIELINDDDLYADINKRLNKDISSANLAQLIDIEKGDTSSNKSSVNVITDEATSGTLTITVYGQNQTQCDAISTAIKSKVSEVTSNLKNTYGNFVLDLTGETSIPVLSNEINESKQNYNTQLYSIMNSMNSLISSLSDNEKTYFNALKQISGVTVKKSKAKWSYSKIIVYAFLMAFLFILCYIILTALRYISDGKVHTSKEFKSLFNTNIIYQLNSDSKQDLVALSNELSYIGKEVENGKVGIVSSLGENYVAKFIDQLDQSTLTQYVVLSQRPVNRADFENIESVNRIIYVEGIENSLADDVVNTVDYYSMKNKKSLGMILLENK